MSVAVDADTDVIAAPVWRRTRLRCATEGGYPGAADPRG
jgi:hypothetical protein